MDSFKEILQSAKDGDEKAFVKLYQLVSLPLNKYLYFKAPGIYEDAASETWYSVAKSLNNFTGNEDDFRNWIFVIARSKVVDILRKKKPTPIEDDLLESKYDDRLGSQDEPSSLVIEEMTTKEAIEFVRDNLKPIEAEVILLRVVVGLPIDQVAKIVKKREGAVRVIQHRSLQKLAQIVGTLPQ